MLIRARGEERRLKELEATLPQGFDYQPFAHPSELDGLPENHLVFDLNLDEEPELILEYEDMENLKLVAGAVKTSLAQLIAWTGGNYAGILIGINSLPTFLESPVKEISLMDESDRTLALKMAAALGWDIALVDDRVGMVAPRVILMIINEACFAVQEGTADMDAIDQAMRYGTNYPYGPFAWADRIGLNEVFETLESIFEDTGDPRYRICPLMKQHYLRQMPFREA